MATPVLGTAAIGHLQGDGTWEDAAAVANPAPAATLAKVTGLADGNYRVGVLHSADAALVCDFQQLDSAGTVKNTQRLRPGGGAGGDLWLELPFKSPTAALDQLLLKMVSGAPTTVQASIVFQRVE